MEPWEIVLWLLVPLVLQLLILLETQQKYQFLRWVPILLTLGFGLFALTAWLPAVICWMLFGANSPFTLLAFTISFVVFFAVFLDKWALLLSGCVLGWALFALWTRRQTGGA